MQQTLQELPLTLAYIGADLLAITLLVGVLYIPRHGRRDLVAAYIGVNVGVLAVTLLLSSSNNVGAGLGLGLFGVLSIIRLRSSSLAQGEVAYFFAALALGLLGGIKSHLIIVAILMVLILASLWVGDHPALMRNNRNQTVVIDRAISNEDELILELEDLLGAQIRSVDLKSLDLVNDTTIVEVHYRLRRRARTAPPAAQPKDTGTGAQQVRQAPQESTPQAPHLIQEVPLQTPTPIQPVGQQAWPGALSHDSAASAATAPPRHDWITGNRQQHTPQRHSQPSAPPPPVANPRYN
ncbi:hypothetical protein HMPREF0975_00749 [Actinomyces sp. oral taxon 849 str. F0330]|uniref:DUF4956 domain-containing protein n=1 Tax=Actinomyces sp. oral taxon 849 TaxID=653385 RepID=UPI000242FF74|nr:DUF4956 domain-containing protein [Actinomyces sp. oral taxon 849]EHM95159.1 hypothetical protein HMPREF0975_00749 [Actinomyces sp. oral taxon 849 str. F0330]